MLQEISNRWARLNRYMGPPESQSHEMRAQKGIYYTLLIMVALVFVICMLCCFFALRAEEGRLLS